ERSEEAHHPVAHDEARHGAVAHGLIKARHGLAPAGTANVIYLDRRLAYSNGARQDGKGELEEWAAYAVRGPSSAVKRATPRYRGRAKRDRAARLGRDKRQHPTNGPT